MTRPRSAPPVVHNDPTCVPVLPLPFQNRSAVTRPATSERQRIPTLTAPPSLIEPWAGVAEAAHTLQGQACAATCTAIPAAGVSRFPLSSTARERSVTLPSAPGVHT